MQPADCAGEVSIVLGAAISWRPASEWPKPPNPDAAGSRKPRGEVWGEH